MGQLHLCGEKTNSHKETQVGFPKSGDEERKRQSGKSRGKNTPTVAQNQL